jgi:hypothetical protein
MTSPALTALFTAAVWFGAFIGLQVLCLRLGAGGARSLVAALGVTTIGMLATTIASAGDHLTLQITMGLLALACLFVLYVPCLYTVLTSLSVRTMILIANAGGSHAAPALHERFASRALIEERLRTLLQAGYVTETGGRYRLTSRGRRIAWPFAALKALWRLGPGG